MTARNQILFWLGGFAVFLLLLYVMRPVLLPFVAGMAIAYLLDPAADKLEKWGMSRTWATATLTAAFFVLFVAMILFLAPVLYDQMIGFLQRLPEYVARLQNFLLPALLALADRVPFVDAPSDVWDTGTSMVQGAAGIVGNTVQRVWNGSLALFNLVSLLLITPVVAFYLLRDWDQITGYIDEVLPRQHAETIREQARRIDDVLAGFVRGQTMVSLVLGLIYAAGLSLIGLEFGLVIGLASGLLSFIPYIGMAVGAAVAIAMALLQFGPDVLHLALVIGTFLLGQALESSILQPRMLGGSVGLHPVWMIFGVLAGGSLFGFVGVLLAVPAMAAAGVLVRFALERYRDSHVYLGPRDPGSE
jgi:predicted PurR-regulated permease PerM